MVKEFQLENKLTGFFNKLGLAPSIKMILNLPLKRSYFRDRSSL